MESERQEKITQHLLTLICVSAFMLFIYALIEQSYAAEMSLAFLSRLFSGYSV
jgi:hypothetical protein